MRGQDTEGRMAEQVDSTSAVKELGLANRTGFKTRRDQWEQDEIKYHSRSLILE